MTLPSDWSEGSSEPWIVDILCALVRAAKPTIALETGGFVGFTSVRLAKALDDHGGLLTVCEIDPTRAATIQAKLPEPHRVVADDVLRYIDSLPFESLGFVFVDDDHTKDHVAQEITALLPKMAPGGIMTFHDVYGSTDLQEVVKRFGGYALDLPRLGPAGGLGILQVP